MAPSKHLLRTYLLKFNSIKVISNEYEYRGSSIITDEMHYQCAYCVYILYDNVARIQCCDRGTWSFCLK